MNQTVLFVCPHGAAKSRMAAAFFDRVAPPGWTASSAGLDPSPEVSAIAVQLLAGTDAEMHLDQAPPRPIAGVASPSRVVGIDCAPDGATDRWELRRPDIDTALRDEIRSRAEALAAGLESGVVGINECRED